MKARLLRSSARQLVNARPGKPIKIAGSARPIREVRSILVPIDFSESSIHALAYAVAFAKQFDSRICLFSVIHDVPTSFESGHSDYETLRESRRRVCQGRLEELLKERVPAALCSRAISAVGKPCEIIVNFARENEVDLIIMARHASLTDEFGLIESTTERVLRYAPCPVLVVRFPERDFVDVGQKQSTRFQAICRDAGIVTDLGKPLSTRKENV